MTVRDFAPVIYKGADAIGGFLKNECARLRKVL
jgi:hypothetical protein